MGRIWLPTWLELSPQACCWRLPPVLRTSKPDLWWLVRDWWGLCEPLWWACKKKGAGWDGFSCGHCPFLSSVNFYLKCRIRERNSHNEKGTETDRDLLSTGSLPRCPQQGWTRLRLGNRNSPTFKRVLTLPPSWNFLKNKIKFLESCNSHNRKFFHWRTLVEEKNSKHRD